MIALQVYRRKAEGGTGNVQYLDPFLFLYVGLLEMTQLTRKLPIALRLILRGSLGPTA